MTLCDSTLTVMNVIQPMRGGSQSKLVACNDGHKYVAKFIGNPQGNRTVIADYFCAKLLKLFQVSTPSVRLLHLPPTIALQQSESLRFAGSNTLPLGYIHFGSQCPVDPSKIALFDFLPRRLHTRIGNLNEFAFMFVFDQWLQMEDSRQALFFRDRSSRRNECTYTASFIDFGFAFGGPPWILEHRYSPAPSLYAMTLYKTLDMTSLVAAAIERIRAVTLPQLLEIANAIPGQWFGPGDWLCFRTLLSLLVVRQDTLTVLVSRHLKAFLRAQSFSEDYLVRPRPLADL